jgi:putative hydroxymethylpyrimidine transport system ATP-binding protein
VEVAIQIMPSRIVCLIGSSGVGKTTFTKLLLGFLPLQQTYDKIAFGVDGKILTPRLAKKFGHIGTMSQDSTLMPWLTIQQNLFLPSELNYCLNKPANQEIIKVFDSIGLSCSILKRFPHELSFGMQQRVAFARAILYVPKFLILDEVFNGLDTINADFLSNEIHKHVHRTNTTCLIVTHDIDRAIEISDEIWFFSKHHHIQKIPMPIKREKILILFKEDAFDSAEFKNNELRK